MHNVSDPLHTTYFFPVFLADFLEAFLVDLSSFFCWAFI